jgi:hypothetical protein
MVDERIAFEVEKDVANRGRGQPKQSCARYAAALTGKPSCFVLQLDFISLGLYSGPRRRHNCSVIGSTNNDYEPYGTVRVVICCRSNLIGIEPAQLWGGFISR